MRHSSNHSRLIGIKILQDIVSILWLIQALCDEVTWGAGEDLGYMEWLAEESLDLASTCDGHLVLL